MMKSIVFDDVPSGSSNRRNAAEESPSHQAAGQKAGTEPNTSRRRFTGIQGSTRPSRFTETTVSESTTTTTSRNYHAVSVYNDVHIKDNAGVYVDDSEVGREARAALERYNRRQQRARARTNLVQVWEKEPEPTQSAISNPAVAPQPIRTCPPKSPAPQNNGPELLKPHQQVQPGSQPDPHTSTTHPPPTPTPLDRTPPPPPLERTPPPPPLERAPPPPPNSNSTISAHSWSCDLLSTPAEYLKPPFATLIVTYGILPVNSVIYLSPRPYLVLRTPNHTAPIPPQIHRSLQLYIYDLISQETKSLAVISSERVEMASRVDEFRDGLGITYKCYLYVSYLWDKRCLALMEIADGDEEEEGEEEGFEEFTNDVPLEPMSRFMKEIEAMERRGVDQIWVKVAEWKEGGVKEVIAVGVWNGWAVLEKDLTLGEDFDDASVTGLGIPKQKEKSKMQAVIQAVELGVEAVTGGTVEELVGKVKEYPVREKVGELVVRVKESPVVERAMEKVADKLDDVKDYINEKGRDVFG